MKELIQLIESNIDSPEVQDVVTKYQLKEKLMDEYVDRNLIQVIYLFSTENGLGIKCDPSNTVKTIFIYSEGKDDYHQFSDSLISKLKFSSLPEEVFSKLGTPSKVGEAEGFGSWIRYDKEKYSLHFSFKEKVKEIELVTIMSLDSVPN